MLDKEDISTAKEIAKVLRESKVDELVVAGNLITVLLAGREQQRTWEGLTDIEINDLVHSHDDFDGLWEFADAVEAKLKEKNT
jgi:Icc-related predicted phosphoesterase